MSVSEVDLNFISNLNLISNNLIYYSCLIFANIGFISNILNILICSRKILREKTFAIYNILMSIFNIINFIFSYIQNFPQTIGKTSIFLTSPIFCPTILYLLRISIQMTSWLNVMISLDRTLCVLRPRLAQKIENKKKLFIRISS